MLLLSLIASVMSLGCCDFPCC